MLPKRFLHYEVIENVCTSGMSEIYKVRNLKLAGRVEALKLLSEKHRKNKDIYSRFRKEAEILSSLDHRSIPVIYEINAFRNRPFITMEFVSGKSLLDITEYKILSLGKIVGIAMDVAAALREAHSRGVIHRDLKLSNIMITRGGRIKIIDFGLAAMGWNTPEEDRGIVIGTLPYMSPEQTRGEQLDHRSDIFSFGICLYELLSGRLPFFDPDPDEVLRRVQEEKPRSIRDVRPEVPESLEHCIFQCIEKDRMKRFQHLDEVAEVLEEVERYLKERGESISSAEASRNRMDSLSIDMVDREEEYGQLAQAYFRAISGKGTSVFIQGEAGIGKTRIIEELLKQLNVSNVYVASGQAHPGMTIPYRPVSDAIRYLLLACDVVTEEDIEAFIEEQYGLDSFQGLILKSFLLHTPSENLEMAGRENLFDAVSDLVAGFADHAPLVMILENVHWADRATLDLLLHLTGAIQGRRILLVISYRTPEITHQAGSRLNLFADIAENKQKTGEAVLIRLDRLSQEETCNLVNYYFPGNAFKKSIYNRIFGESDGNPLFILELLKLFERLGIVVKSNGRWIAVKGEEAFPVPTRIYDLISRRLTSLGPKEMQVLEAAAVEGTSFTSESVGFLIQMDRLTVLNILRSLWCQQLIDLKGDSYRFNPSIVREVIYRQMMPELKREYHGLLGQMYLESPPHGMGDPADVARHFHLGGAPEKAIVHYMEAGYAALNLHADGEALEYFDNALQLLEETPLGPGAKTALDIHLNRAEIFLRMGDPTESGKAAEEALSLARAMSIENGVGGALKMKGKIRHHQGDSEAAEPLLKEALGCSQSISDRAEILNLLGLSAENRGDHKTAMTRFSEALSISNEARNPLRMAQTLNHMGRTFLNKGDSHAALTWFKKAHQMTVEIGDRRGIAVNTNNMGILLRRMDRLGESLRLLFRATRIFKSIRYPNGAANALWNIGQVFMASGNRNKAEKFVFKALRIFEKIGSHQGITLSTLSLANIHAASGSVERAFESFAESFEEGRKIGYPRVVAYGLANRGALELALGLVECAVESLEMAEKEAKECGDFSLAASILGHLGLAKCLAGINREGLYLLESALAAAEASRDTGTLYESCLLLCLGDLSAGELSRAEKNFFKASSHIGRNARPARKADLYFVSGLLEFNRKRPTQAVRKFETALALHQRLDHPLKMLDCIHGLVAAFSALGLHDRRARMETRKKTLLKKVLESITSPDLRERFLDYHTHRKPFEFLGRSGKIEGIP